MGLLLTKEEKISIDEALRVEIPCRTYLGANIDDSYMAKIFAHSYKHDDAFVKDVIQLIDLWSGAFPKGSNIPNTSAYAARLYELLCEDNKLTLLGIKMILDHLIQTKKQVPSIAEVMAEVEPIKQKCIALKMSYEQFMRTYKRAEQDFIKKLTDVGITNALSDVLDFSELIYSGVLTILCHFDNMQYERNDQWTRQEEHELGVTGSRDKSCHKDKDLILGQLCPPCRADRALPARMVF